MSILIFNLIFVVSMACSKSSSSDENDAVDKGESDNTRKYVVIEFFDDGLQLVPQKWLTENLKRVYFPNLKNINSKMYDKMVLNSVNPDYNSWKLYKIKKLWASSDDFIRAKQKLKMAEVMSTSDDLNSESDVQQGKLKRRLLAKKKLFHDNTPTYITNIVKHKRKTEAVVPPLPYNPFQNYDLQNSKSQNGSKNVKKMAKMSVTSDNENDYVILKDDESKYDKLINQPMSPTLISSQKLNFNNLGGCTLSNENNNTSELSAIVSPLGKSPNAKFSNEQLLISRQLSFDLAPMPELFKSSQVTLQSTPKSTNKQHEINFEKLMTYITTTLPEINVKLNKVLLNQSKIEKMLIDLKNTQPVLDNSNVESNDILEYFPLTTLEKLDKFNQELKNDRELLKRFKHTIKPYGVTSVLQAIKSILDLLLTNELGQKISLTGRGINNIQEKKAFKSLYLYKIISSTIVRHIKDATVLDINKAITGWLKHAGDRHERSIQKICHTDLLNADQFANDSDT